MIGLGSRGAQRREHLKLCASVEWRQCDNLATAGLAWLYHDDTYNSIRPDMLPDRLAAAGFVNITVHANSFGWAAHARRPMCHGDPSYG